jgi:hypothetical protein
MIKTDVMVEKDLENRNVCSIKLAAGKKSMAIKKARKKGAKMLWPNANK